MSREAREEAAERLIAEGFTRLRDQDAWHHYLDVLTTDAGGGYAALEVYKAREGDCKMAWKLAAQRAGGLQGLLGESSDLDAVVIGDPMGGLLPGVDMGKG